MAQTTQIVPKFPYPYVEMHVNDYTLVEDEAVSEDTIEPASIQAYAFQSGKGIDNVWVKKTNRTSAEKMFGKCNYRKYGQPYMQALNVVDQDSSHVWMMRVMPEDATFANTLVCVGYKEVERKVKVEQKNEDNTPKKDEDGNILYEDKVVGYDFEVKFFNKSIVDNEVIKTSNGIDEFFKKPSDGFIPGTVDGYKLLPLFMVRYAGRGKCGDSYSLRIVPALTYEKEYGIVFYNFQCIDSSNGISVDTNYTAGISPSVKYGSKVATQIDDILSYTNEGIIPMYIKTNDDTIDAVFEAYREFVDKYSVKHKEYDDFSDEEKAYVKELTVDQFNLIYGTKVGSESVSLPGFVVGDVSLTGKTEDWTDTNFTSIKGIELSNGSDGDALTASGPGSLSDLYVKAYDGTFDRKILSPSRMAVRSFWDANYPLDVKKALVDLVLTRGDARCQLDVGLVNSLSIDNVNTLIDDYAWLDDHQVSVDIHNYDVKDPATQKKVPVTISYLLSAGYVNHVIVYGYHTPYVRKKCMLEGHVKNSLRPVIDDCDKELKTKLYNNRFNYFESISEDEFVRACQNTTQKDVTDLLEENDSRILIEMENFCYKRVGDHLYNFADSTVRADFIDVTKELIRNEFGSKVQDIDIYFAVSKFESEHSIIHLYLSVTFFGLDKQAIVEIDLNKRQFNNGLEDE